MEIELEFGIATQVPMNITLVDVFEKDQHSKRRGGTHIHHRNGITIFQNAWHKFKLEHSYIMDEFTRMQFKLFMTREVDFIGLCLSTKEELRGITYVDEDADGNSGSITSASVDTDANVDVKEPELHACIHLFGADTTWYNSGISPIHFNLALGKPSVQNSYFQGYNPRNAVDGNLKSAIYTDLVQNPTWEVSLEGQYIIHTIVLHKNTDKDYELMDDAKDMNVMVYDKKDIKVFHSEYFQLTESVKFIPLPQNTKASRVVVTLTDADANPRILSLMEVQVFADWATGIDRGAIMDIPLGPLFANANANVDADTDNFGREVNYLTFVQGTSRESDVSNIQDFKFIYGSSPDLDAYADSTPVSADNGTGP